MQHRFFVPSVSHGVTKNTSDWCYTFTEPIFNGKYEMYSDAHSSAVSYGMKKEEKMYFDVLTKTKNDISALHIVLEKEGFKISDTEKNQKTFKESTVGAVLSLQKKYKNDTLSVNGFSKGIVSRDGVLWLNKVYGCKKESNSTKQFAVVSPNGGEQYNTVGSFTVRWTPVIEKLAKKIVVYLVDTITGKKSVLKEVTPSITQIVYTLPKNGIEGSVTGIGTFLDARYKIEVQVLDSKVKVATNYSNQVQYIPYGTLFTNIQSLSQFLLNYGA
ncbi:MAG: hypothetical protein FGM57_03725, partial [Candidatus Taylorbacteria bacterium]|nr:hypothetical protein [Candidatus Taylorbacteria bacterium]